MLINPSSQLILDGMCKDGCDNGDVKYKYTVYTGTMTNSIDLSWTQFGDPLNLFPGKFIR